MLPNGKLLRLGITIITSLISRTLTWSKQARAHTAQDITGRKKAETEKIFRPISPAQTASQQDSSVLQICKNGHL